MIVDEFGCQSTELTLVPYLSFFTPEVIDQFARDAEVYQALNGCGLVDQYGCPFQLSPMMVSCRSFRLPMELR